MIASTTSIKVRDTFNPYWYLADEYSTLSVSFKGVTTPYIMTPDWEQVKYYSDAAMTKEITNIYKGGTIYAQVPAKYISSNVEYGSKYTMDKDGNVTYVPQNISLKLSVTSKSIKNVYFYNTDIYGIDFDDVRPKDLRKAENYTSRVYAPLNELSDPIILSVDTLTYATHPEYYFLAIDKTAENGMANYKAAWNALRGIDSTGSDYLQDVTIVLVESYNGDKDLVIVDSWNTTRYLPTYSSSRYVVSMTLGNKTVNTTITTPDYTLADVELNGSTFTVDSEDASVLYYDALTPWTIPTSVSANLASYTGEDVLVNDISVRFKGVGGINVAGDVVPSIDTLATDENNNKYLLMYVDAYATATAAKQTLEYKLIFNNLGAEITKVEFGYDSNSTADDLKLESSAASIGSMATIARITISGDTPIEKEVAVTWELLGVVTVNELTEGIARRSARFGTGIDLADDLVIEVDGEVISDNYYEYSGHDITFAFKVINATEIEIGNTTWTYDANATEIETQSYTLKTSEFTTGLPKTVNYKSTVEGSTLIVPLTVRWVNASTLEPLTYTIAGLTHTYVYAQVVADHITINYPVYLTIEPISIKNIVEVEEGTTYYYDPYGIITNSDLAGTDQQLLFESGSMQNVYLEGETMPLTYTSDIALVEEEALTDEEKANAIVINGTAGIVGITLLYNAGLYLKVVNGEEVKYYSYNYSDIKIAGGRIAIDTVNNKATVTSTNIVLDTEESNAGTLLYTFTSASLASTAVTLNNGSTYCVAVNNGSETRYMSFQYRGVSRDNAILSIANINASTLSVALKNKYEVKVNIADDTILKATRATGTYVALTTSELKSVRNGGYAGQRYAYDASNKTYSTSSSGTYKYVTANDLFGTTVKLPITYVLADGVTVNSEIDVYIADRSIKRITEAKYRSIVVDPFYYSSFGSGLDGYGYPTTLNVTMKNTLVDGNATFDFKVELPDDKLIETALTSGAYINSGYQMKLAYQIDAKTFAYQYVTVPLTIINRTMTSEFLVVDNDYKLAKAVETMSKLTLTYINEDDASIVRYEYSKSNNRISDIYFDNAFSFDVSQIPDVMHITFSNGEGKDYHITKEITSAMSDETNAKSVQRMTVLIKVYNKDPSVAANNAVVIDEFSITVARSVTNVTKYNSNIVYDDDNNYNYTFDPYADYLDSVYNTKYKNTSNTNNFAQKGTFYVDGQYVLYSSYVNNYKDVRYVEATIKSMSQYSDWAVDKEATGANVYKVFEKAGNPVYYKYNPDTKMYYVVDTNDGTDTYVFVYSVIDELDLEWNTSGMSYTYAGGVKNAQVTMSGANGVAKETINVPVQFIDKTVDNDDNRQGGIKIANSSATGATISNNVFTFDPFTVGSSEFLTARKEDGYTKARYAYDSTTGVYVLVNNYYNKAFNKYYTYNSSSDTYTSSSVEPDSYYDVSEAIYKYVAPVNATTLAGVNEVMTEGKYVEMTDYEIYGSLKYFPSTGKAVIDGQEINVDIVWAITSVTISYEGGTYYANAYINYNGEYNYYTGTKTNNVGTQRTSFKVVVTERTVVSASIPAAISGQTGYIAVNATTGVGTLNTFIDPYKYQAPTMPTSLTVNVKNGNSTTTKTFTEKSGDETPDYELAWSFSKFRPSYKGGVVYVQALLTGPDGITQTYRIPYAVYNMDITNVTTVASSLSTNIRYSTYPYTSTVTNGEAATTYTIHPYAPVSQNLPSAYYVTMKQYPMSSVTFGSDGYASNYVISNSSTTIYKTFSYAKVGMPAAYALKLSGGVVTDGVAADARYATIYFGSQQRVRVRYTLADVNPSGATFSLSTGSSYNLNTFSMPTQSGSATCVWFGYAQLTVNGKTIKQAVTFSAGDGSAVKLKGYDRDVTYYLRGAIGAVVDKNGTLLDTQTLTSDYVLYSSYKLTKGTIIPRYVSRTACYSVTVTAAGSITVSQLAGADTTGAAA